MGRIRMVATSEHDGELHLRGLPIRRGQQADVIVLTEPTDGGEVLAVLGHDPGWAWLWDDAEDIYTEADLE